MLTSPLWLVNIIDEKLIKSRQKLKKFKFFIQCDQKDLYEKNIND